MYIIHNTFYFNGNSYTAVYTAEEVLKIFKEETNNLFADYIDAHEIANLINDEGFSCIFSDDVEENEEICCDLCGEIFDICDRLSIEYRKLNLENVEEFYCIWDAIWSEK